MEKIPLIVIAGPTASGKTALAVKLAKALGTEIVTADSMQVYKGMDIGTAKPDLNERMDIVHHLIDVCEPYEKFSVADYCALAHEAIRKIYQSGKIPILTGGTGLYIDSVVKDIDFSESSSDEALRESLYELAKQNGNEYVYRMLEREDPEVAARLHSNDLKRVVRALEVKKTTGKSILELEKESRRTESRYKTLYFAIKRDRRELYERINKRVDLMIEKGLVDEVRRLMNSFGKTALQGLGYKEMLYYLRGLATLEEAVEILKRDTRRYAKRQLTWFRKNNDIIWINAENGLEVILNKVETEGWLCDFREN